MFLFRKHRHRGLAPAGLLVISLFCNAALRAQAPAPSFAEKSSTAYKADIARLQAREVTDPYGDSREAQRLYKKAIDGRNAYIAEAFSGDELIKDSILLARCGRVLQQLKLGNPTARLGNLHLYIARSAEPNARCFGEGTLFLNLGIFPLIENDAELAFLIGHEAAHQLLDHPETKIRNRVDRQTSGAFQKEVRNTGRDASRYFTLLRRVSLEDGENDRQAEVEADSLALVLATNAGYAPADAARFILKLASADEVISGNDLYDVRKALAVADAPPARTGYVGLSGVKINLKSKSEFDSLRKTHPDAPFRYTKMTGLQPPAEPVKSTGLLRQTADPQETTREFLEMIRYFLEAGKYSLALHYALVAGEAGLRDPAFGDIIAAALAGIHRAELQGRRYQATFVFTSTANSLRALQTGLDALNKTDLAALTSRYLSQNPDPARDSHAYAIAMQQIAVEGTPVAVATADYLKKFPQGRFAPLLKSLSVPKSTP